MVADTTARILRLLSLLQTHRFWAGPELAERLAVSARTLRRDIDRLRLLGYTVDATPGAAGGYRLAKGAHVPPLLLDDDEAVAIAVGLRRAAGSAVAGVEESGLRALAKLQQVLPDRLRRRVAALHGNVSTLEWSRPDQLVDPDVLVVLAQACRDCEEVRFEYARRDGAQGSRLVQPHQVVAVGRRWYLVAWDRRRDDWRTFRLDRISDARAAGARFDGRPIPGGDAASFVASSLRSMPLAHRAVITVDAPGSEVAELARWFGSDLETLDGPSCRFELRSDRLDSLVSMVALLAARHAFRVDADDEVLSALDAASERIASARSSGVRLRTEPANAAVT